MRGRPEELLVAGRGLGAAACALVEKLGCASASCVRGQLAVGARSMVGNVFPLVVCLRRWHLGRYFLGELAFLRLEWDVTA